MRFPTRRGKVAFLAMDQQREVVADAMLDFVFSQFDNDQNGMRDARERVLVELKTLSALARHASEQCLVRDGWYDDVLLTIATAQFRADTNIRRIEAGGIFQVSQS